MSTRSPQVIKLSTSFDVNDSSDLPDAKSLAAQYGVDHSDDDDDDSLTHSRTQPHTHSHTHSHTHHPSESNNTYNEQHIMNQMHTSQQDNERVEKLVTKLDSKNKEIERLCVLLETIEMVPGADPDKYLDVINGNDEEVDFRDTKIVHLAKKCRNLTVLLNKERAQKEKAGKQLIALQDELDRTKRELELVSTPAARAQARKSSASTERDDDGTPRKDLKKELSQASKQVDEWRKKAQSAQEEVKKMSRVLAKELGDGVTIDQAVDDGWKGRAQQIVMLKSKISRLEKDGAAGSKMSTNSRFRSSQAKGVDAKAEEELSSMSQERQQAVEALTEDHARLSQEVTQLSQKVDRGKARVRALESDAATHKTQLKVLVEKTESDDSLIEALTEELRKVTKDATEYEKKYKEAVMNASGTRPMREMVAVKGKGGTTQVELNAGQDTAAELARLRRLVTQQGAQLETQETIIRQLRAKSTKK